MARTIQRSKPPYAQVADDLRNEILDGTLQPGVMLPSERKLAEEYGISRATATKAVASLRQQGLVESVVGVGTKVAEGSGPLTLSPSDRYRNLQRTRQVRVLGETSEFEVGVVRAPGEVRRELRLESDSEALYRSRVTRNDEGAVVELSTSWFDAAWLTSCPNLVVKTSIREGTTAYVAACRKVEVGTAYDVLTAVPAGKDAQRLQVDSTAPIIRTAVTVFDQMDSPLTYEVYRHPPAHRAIYEYELEVAEDS